MLETLGYMLAPCLLAIDEPTWWSPENCSLCRGNSSYEDLGAYTATPEKIKVNVWSTV